MLSPITIVNLWRQRVGNGSVEEWFKWTRFQKGTNSRTAKLEED